MHFTHFFGSPSSFQLYSCNSNKWPVFFAWIEVLCSCLYVRVYRYIVKFSNFMSRELGFWLPVLSQGESFCTEWLSQGRVFAPFKSCPWGLSGGDGYWWNWYLHYTSLKFFRPWRIPLAPPTGFRSAALAVYEIAGVGIHLDPPFYVRCV